MSEAFPAGRGTAFAAGRDAATSVIAELMEGVSTSWQPDWTFIFIMGLRAQRDGWGGKADAHQYLNGVLAASAVFEEYLNREPVMTPDAGGEG